MSAGTKAAAAAAGQAPADGAPGPGNGAGGPTQRRYGNGLGALVDDMRARIAEHDAGLATHFNGPAAEFVVEEPARDDRRQNE